MDWLFWIDLSGELVALDGLAGWDNYRTDGWKWVDASACLVNE